MSSSSSSLVSRMARFIANVALVYIDLHILAYLFGLHVSTVSSVIKNNMVICMQHVTDVIKSAATIQLTYFQIQVVAVFAIICAMMLFATLLFVINVADHKNENVVTKDALIAGLSAQVSQLHLDMADKNDDIDRLKHVIANMLNNNKVEQVVM
jgi:hypothetical protein